MTVICHKVLCQSHVWLNLLVRWPESYQGNQVKTMAADGWRMLRMQKNVFLVNITNNVKTHTHKRDNCPRRNIMQRIRNVCFYTSTTIYYLMHLTRFVWWNAHGIMHDLELTGLCIYSHRINHQNFRNHSTAYLHLHYRSVPTCHWFWFK